MEIKSSNLFLFEDYLSRMGREVEQLKWFLLWQRPALNGWKFENISMRRKIVEFVPQTQLCHSDLAIFICKFDITLNFSIGDIIIFEFAIHRSVVLFPNHPNLSQKFRAHRHAAILKIQTFSHYAWEKYMIQDTDKPTHPDIQVLSVSLIAHFCETNTLGRAKLQRDGTTRKYNNNNDGYQKKSFVRYKKASHSAVSFLSS